MDQDHPPPPASTAQRQGRQSRRLWCGNRRLIELCGRMTLSAEHPPFYFSFRKHVVTCHRFTVISALPPQLRPSSCPESEPQTLCYSSAFPLIAAVGGAPSAAPSVLLIFADEGRWCPGVPRQKWTIANLSFPQLMVSVLECHTKFASDTPFVQQASYLPLQ